MRTVVIGPQFIDSFARNVAITLESMGHEVLAIAGTRVRHNGSRFRNTFWRSLPLVFPQIELQTFKKTLRKIRGFRPSLVLVTHDLLSPEQIEKAKKAAQAPVVCWFIDPVTNLGSGRLFSAHYDRFFFKEPILVEIFRDRLGKPAECLPEACNPMWHRPVNLSDQQLREYGCDVATQGTLHPYRAEFYDVFAETPWEVKIWGSNTTRSVRNRSRGYLTGRYIGEHEKAIAFRAARAVVNNMGYGEMRGVNQTLFEAAGCGAFVLCDAKPQLPELFQVDEEIVTFTSRGEMLDKLRYYLSPSGETERLRIRERAWRRAHRDHTFEHRLRTMLSRLSLEPPR